MVSAGLVDVLLGIVYVLWFLIGLAVYAALFAQLARRSSLPAFDEPPPVRTFGLPEAITALVLICFLLLNVLAASLAPAVSQLSSKDLVANLVLTIAVLLILIGFFWLRGLQLDQLAGLSKIRVTRAIATGGLLLLAAYPLISAADAITRRFLSESGSSKQNIVELFNSSSTMSQRIMIIVLAVAIAPIAEEFVFRFFLYGVLKRYLGVFAALAFTSILFGAVHAHLPSFAPLFILGACFALAYEWTGSILVSMTMHSLFNSISLVFLAFPQLSER